MKLYLANPLGFSEAGRAFLDTALVPELRAAGHEVLDPWKLTEQSKIDAVRSMPASDARLLAWRKINEETAATNTRAIDECDAVLAVLDGQDVDSGTAAEIGYAFGKGKPIVGYRGDFRICSDNEGSIVNLQVEYFIHASGGTIVTRLADVRTALARIG